MKTYFEEQMQVINNAVKSLDTETFTQLVTECEAVLSDGHKIILSGLGKNVPVCEKFVGTMNSFGLAAAFMNTNTAVHGDIGMVQNGDLVIILTKSGDTSESVYLSAQQHTGREDPKTCDSRFGTRRGCVGYYSQQLYNSQSDHLTRTGYCAFGTYGRHPG